MTSQEFAQFVLEVNATFRGDRIGAVADDDAEGAARLAAYRVHLGDQPYEDAAGALRLLVQDGQVFTPTPGEMVGALKRMTRTEPSLPWAIAWPKMQRVLGKRPQDRERLVDGLAEPMRSFVISYGIERLAREETEDPDHGGAVLHRLGQDYARFVGDYEDGTRVALARGEGGPRRLDPVAALGYVHRVPDEGAQG